MNKGDIERMLAAAEPAVHDGPLPLFPPLGMPAPYPVEALGPVLSPAAAAISRKVQVPPAMAAQSVLAAASLVAQAYADVMLPFGQTRPLSLYFVTVAASGDRKTTADGEALWPIKKREKALREARMKAHQTWLVERAAWEAEKRKIVVDGKLDLDQRRHALVELGAEPAQPLHAFLTVPDPTVEGLAKAWVSALPALGVFTAEGGQFVGGHGMSDEHRLKTAATYSALWDGEPFRRVRAGDGVTILPGRRLAMHIMVQPDAAEKFLSDGLLRDQGLLSRVLVAAPPSVAGSRLYRETRAEDDAAIRAYGARLLRILELPLPLAEGCLNELEPRVLHLSAEAKNAFEAFYNHVERQSGAEKELSLIPDFAAKAAEQAARIAGVLTVVEDQQASEIRTDTMARAIALTDWYVDEALRLRGVARVDPALRAADGLLQWMRRQGKPKFSFRDDIMQCGPRATRTKKAAEAALRVLEDHGYISDSRGNRRIIRLISAATT